MQKTLRRITGEPVVRKSTLSISILVAVLQKNSRSTFVIKHFRKKLHVHIIPKILVLKLHKRHFNIHVYRRTITSGNTSVSLSSSIRFTKREQLELI